VYRRHNPKKLADVDGILRAFKGNEEELIRSVSAKYAEEFRVADVPRQTKQMTRKRGSSQLLQAVQYEDVVLVDPFTLRLDVDQERSRADISVLIEPVACRLTNGNLKSVRTAFLGDGSLQKWIKALPMATERPPVSVFLTAVLQGAELALLTEYSSQSVPLIRASLSGVALKLARDDSGLVMSLDTIACASSSPEFKVDHFNPRLLAWEPLVEPWEFAFVKHANQVVEFVSKSALNLNLSYSFVESFANWLAWRSARHGSRHDQSSDHYIVNETGLVMEFWVEHGGEAAPKLESGQRAALRLRASASPVARNNENVEEGLFFRDTRSGMFAQVEKLESTEENSAAAAPKFAPQPQQLALLNFKFLLGRFLRAKQNDQLLKGLPLSEPVRLLVHRFGFEPRGSTEPNQYKPLQTFCSR
jgi:hypothetical protein